MHGAVHITLAICSIEVFRSKVLQAHHHNTYGDDSDSSSSSEPPHEDFEPPDNKAPPKTTGAEPQDELEGSVQEAISILKEHRTFMQKQHAIVERHHERAVHLPRVVTSRALADTEGTASSTGNSQQREVSQVEKNRKRKLKKRKAKEKRQKIEGT